MASPRPARPAARGRWWPRQTSAPTRTPSRRMRRSSGTRFRHSPAARRIARASCVGASIVLVARHRLEVVEAQLEADRPADVALALQIVARRPRTSSVKIARQLLAVARARDRSRSNVVSRLIDFGSLYGHARRARRGRARRRASTRRGCGRNARSSHAGSAARARRSCGCRAPRACALDFGPDAVDLARRQRPDARGDVVGAQDRQAVRLVELGGDLGEQLVRRDADRARQPGRRAHRVLDRLRDVARAPPRVARGSRARRRAAATHAR